MKSKNILPLIFSIITLNSVFATERPRVDDNLAVTKEICQAWSKSSQSKGVTQLIVAFEGLASYSAKAAEATYKYYDELKKSSGARAPRIGSMNFLNENLIVPNMNEIIKESEILILSESSQRKKETVAETCLKSWDKQFKGNLRIILLGHSFGGYAVLNLAKKLQESKINIAQALTMDARAMPNEYVHFKKPNNINQFWNFFHKGPWMPGYAIKGAENQRVRTDHVGVTKIEVVQEKFLEIL